MGRERERESGQEEREGRGRYTKMMLRFEGNSQKHKYIYAIKKIIGKPEFAAIRTKNVHRDERGFLTDVRELTHTHMSRSLLCAEGGRGGGR